MDKEFKEEVVFTLETILDSLRTVAASLGPGDTEAIYGDIWRTNKSIGRLKELLEEK